MCICPKKNVVRCRQQVNVVGLENVLKAAKRTTTVKKIVYTSSYFAIGPTDGYIADEMQVQYELFFSLSIFSGMHNSE
jgi:nucleoside-diphosphate-sugar epimerase